jgi:UDP-glucose 4-epimerase
MRILVTGGAGFIGSTTAAHFIAAGHEVIVFDNLSRGHRQAVPAQAEFIQGDVCDRAALDAVMAKFQPEAVAHFAAFIEAGESMQNPGLYLHNNVSGAISLLESMITHEVKKIVFSSTAAVYASKNAPLNEDDPLGPSNLYGETKLMIETMLGWYHRIHSLRYCALRYFNAAGAMLDGNASAIRGEAHQPESHLIPLTLQVPLGQRESMRLFGSDYPTPDGTCVRDYIHIEDLASAHVLALDGLKTYETLIYNLGNGQGYSNRQVIDIARAVSGHSIPVIETERRPGDAAILIASSEKINHDLGWKPRYSDLKDIIASAWDWHREHPQGYHNSTD